MRRALFLCAWTLGAQACSAPRSEPARVYFAEVDRYQVFYAADGTILRMHYDGDRDRSIDALTFFRRSGRLRAAEIDTDKDGAIDRWESYGEDGRLESTASRPNSRPKP